MSDIVYNRIKSIASQLTPTEMIRLAGWLEANAELALHNENHSSEPTDFKDLYGVWSDVHVSAEDIEEVRREMLTNFPHEDI